MENGNDSIRNITFYGVLKYLEEKGVHPIRPGGFVRVHLR